VKAQLRAQDDYLERQLQNVNLLGEMSSALGTCATSQNSQLDELGSQVESVNDDTRSVIRMQGRLHRSVRGAPKFKAFVVLSHHPTGRLLQVFDGGQVGLSSSTVTLDDVPLGARWEVHEREGDKVVGFRSLASRQWLGQNLMGGVRVRGSAFGSWEGFEADFARPKPILCCSANAYSGGWLYVSTDGLERLEAKTASRADKRSAPLWKVYDIGNAAAASAPHLRLSERP